MTAITMNSVGVSERHDISTTTAENTVAAQYAGGNILGNKEIAELQLYAYSVATTPVNVTVRVYGDVGRERMLMEKTWTITAAGQRESFQPIMPVILGAGETAYISTQCDTAGAFVMSVWITFRNAR